jgi:hypothetical protein
MRTILDTRVFEKANATTFVTDRKVVASESIGLILDLNDALKCHSDVRTAPLHQQSGV